MARTVVDLGMEDYNRYANDQKLLDPKIILEARSIPPLTQIDVTSVVFPNELNRLIRFDVGGVFWGEVSKPPLYDEQAKRVFTTQIVPSLGTEERRMRQMERIQSISAKQKMEKPEFAWQETQLKRQRADEAIKLQALYETLGKLERDYAEITSYRSQFQKG